jgi:hypothetical protein
LAPLGTRPPLPYNISAIRKPLLAALTAEELRRFCRDRLQFRPVARGMDSDMVDRVIEN